MFKNMCTTLKGDLTNPQKIINKMEEIALSRAMMKFKLSPPVISYITSRNSTFFAVC